MILIPKHSNKQKGLYFPLCSRYRMLTFSFDESFIYRGKNQTDLHKIFGVGVLCLGSFKNGKNKRWWELHKWYSLRVGARWNPFLKCVEITDYSYVKGVGERNTDDNKILKVKLGEKCKAFVSLEYRGMRLVATNLTTNETIDVLIPCNLPAFFLPLRLRAYMENVYRTKDVIIHTHK